MRNGEGRHDEGGETMTTREIKIEVEHITRVEGHGDIILNAKDGELN